MLIHATITVTGGKDALTACEARLRRLLSAQFLRNEATEHHGPQALCYDLKVEGGIPFPPFTQASQEFPDLQFLAEWVNLAAGEKCRATLVGGRILSQDGERIATRAGEDHPVHVEVTADGKLALALTFQRATREEWRGYALTATRDAALRVLRAPESDGVELYATEGGPQWVVRWAGALSARAFIRDQLRPPVAIAQDVFQELDGLARKFVADWVWFASEARSHIAIEHERYSRAGYEPADANVRWAKLHRMRADAVEGQPLVYSTLAADEQWLKDLVLASWVRDS